MCLPWKTRFLFSLYLPSLGFNFLCFCFNIHSAWYLNDLSLVCASSMNNRNLLQPNFCQDRIRSGFRVISNQTGQQEHQPPTESLFGVPFKAVLIVWNSIRLMNIRGYRNAYRVWKALVTKTVGEIGIAFYKTKHFTNLKPDHSFHCPFIALSLPIWLIIIETSSMFEYVLLPLPKFYCSDLSATTDFRYSKSIHLLLHYLLLHCTHLLMYDLYTEERLHSASGLGTVVLSEISSIDSPSFS